MRQERTAQASIFDVFATHEIGRELKAMSQWLDEHRDLLGLVARDLGAEQELLEIIRRLYQPKTATADLMTTPPSWLRRV